MIYYFINESIAPLKRSEAFEWLHDFGLESSKIKQALDVATRERDYHLESEELGLVFDIYTEETGD